VSNLCLHCVYTDSTSSGPTGEIAHFRRTAGQSVTFPCVALSTEPVDWWFQNETAVHQICSVGLIINSFKTDGRFALRRALTGDWSLTVRNLRPSDSGVYICRTDDDEYFNLTVLRKYL